MSYDQWKQIDTQGERDSYERAKLENLTMRIRQDMKASDFVQEIECDASFDTDCIKAIQMLFIGADPVTCAKVLTDFADKWLDRQAEKIARQYQ